jgi:aryl-alcohol dehydrogenase-like predicted oxidoreductase|tara:strand:+ start:1742 stop:2761 length:1020 start_codon:yes stop_codon:yes gene_type:complete
MQHRYLGNSGLKISEIIYGNWLTHGSQVTDEQAIKTVHAALDGGITTFDTADVYANLAAEKVMGDALKSQRREGLEILTKVYWPVAEMGPNDVGLSRKHIMESIDGSLRRLQTDYVDLYQAHRFDHETPLEETMQAFADLVRMGKVLYVGVSEWSAEQIQQGQALASQMGYRLISNQPQYSMLWRVIEKKVVPASQELGLSQIVWSPLAQGVLTGKYLPGAELPEDSRATVSAKNFDFMEKFLSDDLLTKIQKLVPLADQLGLSLAQFSIAWVLQNKNIAAAIVGASKPEQITSNIKASGVEIPAELMKKADEILGDSIVTDPELTKSPNPRPIGPIGK